MGSANTQNAPNRLEKNIDWISRKISAYQTALVTCQGVRIGGFTDAPANDVADSPCDTALVAIQTGGKETSEMGTSEMGTGKAIKTHLEPT